MNSNFSRYQIRLLMLFLVKAGLKGLNSTNRGCSPRLEDHQIPATPDGVELELNGLY